MPALVLVGVVFLKLFSRRLDERFRVRSVDSGDGLGSESKAYPEYVCCPSLLTPTEIRFHRGLKTALKPWYSVSCKTRLEDIIRVRNDVGRKLRFSCRNRIKSRHVDFLVYDPVDTEIIAAIELDDSSHLRRDRQERDRFVNDLFASCGLPLLRVPVSREYDFDEIANQIRNPSVDNQYSDRCVVAN